MNVNDKEGRMSNRHRGAGVGLGILAVAAAALIAVAVAAGGTRQAACGNVVLNENSWVGSTANVYVVKNVLEKRLKCKVKVLNITENQPSFQAMADGKIDVVLEDWDNTHIPSNKKYVTSKAVVNVGGNGITGVIGWYIPRYLLKQYPLVQDVEGAQGQGVRVQVAGVRLAGHVPRRRPVLRAEGPRADQGARPQPEARRGGGGARAGRTLDAAVQAEEASALLLVRPAVPERGVRRRPDPAAAALQGVRDDEKLKGNHACEYPSYGLDKLVSGDFAKSGSPALKVIRKFTWTSADQNFVANLISGKKMAKDKAAAAWVQEQGQGQRLAEVS